MTVIITIASVAIIIIALSICPTFTLLGQKTACVPLLILMVVLFAVLQ